MKEFVCKATVHMPRLGEGLALFIASSEDNVAADQ